MTSGWNLWVCTGPKMECPSRHHCRTCAGHIQYNFLHQSCSIYSADTLNFLQNSRTYGLVACPAYNPTDEM